jgi:hypothetical protein
LIFSIAEILAEKLETNGRNHEKLISSLENIDSPKNFSFVSLNYDILIDNALIKAKERYNLDLDYKVNFTNPQEIWKSPKSEKSIQLFKLHGSLNWLFCPTCCSLTLTPKEKGVLLLKTKPSECQCKKCKTISIPIIIPPTYFKVLSNFYLQQIWHEVELAFANCSRIIFCGYSFPDADIHIKYLLKRIEVNGRNRPEIYVINHFDRKSQGQTENEQERYFRFFSKKDKIKWTDLSFEKFCSDPSEVFNSIHHINPLTKNQ